MPHHKTRTLYYRNMPVEIDEGIAPLIEAIWKRGLETCFSCECDPDSGQAYVEFSDVRDAEYFAQIVGGDLELRQQLELEARLHWKVWTKGDNSCPGVPCLAISFEFPPELIEKMADRVKASVIR